MVPAPSSLVNYVKHHIKSRGGVVLIGNKDIVEHLDSLGVDAASLNDIVMFYENPTRSELLEEMFHFDQYLRGDYEGESLARREILREIDAKRYLLSVEKKDNIPRIETEETKEELRGYLDRLRRLGEMDEST